MKKILYILVLISFLSLKLNAQLDSIINFTTSFIGFPYISDGQQYRAMLTSDQTAEFHMVFYGGATYRIVAASEPKDASLIFRLYDKNRVELFSNENFKNSVYWDFYFESTVECLIEAQLPEGKVSGFVIMFLGFKQQ